MIKKGELGKLILGLTLIFVLSAEAVFSAEGPDFVDRSGTKLRLTQGQSATVTYSDREYTLTIDVVNDRDGYVILHIDSKEPKKIFEGQSSLFDVMYDNREGIMVEIVGIIGKDVNMKVKRVESVQPAVETPIEPQGSTFEIISGEVVKEDESPLSTISMKNVLIVLLGVGIILLVFFFVWKLVKRK